MDFEIDEDTLDMMMDEEFATDFYDHWMKMEVMDAEDDQMTYANEFSNFYRPITSCDPIKGGTMSTDAIIEKLVESRGFAAKVYDVSIGKGQTIDIFRLVRKSELHEKGKSAPQAQRPPVLLMPGMFQTWESFLRPGTGKSGDQDPIAIQALKAGYDVWIGNSRGTQFSHGKFKGDFDWQEMGEDDLPKMIEKVLHYSDHKKLDYLGYEQGSTEMFFAMSKDNSFYNKHVNMFTSLAPCTRMKFTRNPIFMALAQYYRFMKELETKRHVKYFNDKYFNKRLASICKGHNSASSFAHWICELREQSCGDVRTPLQSMLHYM